MIGFHVVDARPLWPSLQHTAISSGIAAALAHTSVDFAAIPAGIDGAPLGVVGAPVELSGMHFAEKELASMCYSHRFICDMI